MIHRGLVIAVSLALGQAVGHAANAGPERVQFPDDYADTYLLYGSIEKPGLRTIRQLYVAPEVLQQIRPDQPLPDGMVLVMEELETELDASGESRRDKHDRFVPTGEIKQILVSKKGAGWGAAYLDEELMAGDWEFAAFNSDGSRKVDADHDGCRSCHQQASVYDFTFSLFPRLDALKTAAN